MSDAFDAYGHDLLHGGFRQRSKKENLSARDKLQPSLLDRLTDDAPHKTSEAAHSTLISHTQLRRNVLRDLQWLFNCINSEAIYDLNRYDEVRRSVVNFGVVPLSGKRMSDIEWGDIQRKLTDAILHFEPRILPHGLQVRCISELNSLDLHNVLSIEIKGRLWCVPYPLEFLFRTDVDLESGHFKLEDIG
ncbi:type VI secretion system baseplate subunit TssE [Ewingella americana]|uniref:ImpF family protein n=2 Tax=Ewingella americana TaxID=41202 RepID=A0A085GNZ3_EWIA3|nr:type VI secretion system baseplate subunit TssE [Ewingella americana]KAA8725840.1 type VI secretion system baseplate subunit TssE [Ewingella americana]KFC85438.1 ImpF family protein [Ewingella americana ATCC 33852]STQ46152.1 type VI secretion system lysozyme-like protein [Ewingella americana]